MKQMNDGNMVLGIELGSTRIKAVLLNEKREPVATGSFEWESRYENGFWTYPLSLAEEGVRAAYRDLIRDLGRPLETLGAIGISGMMHGYLPFDQEGNLLTPFRTWQNTTTGQASKELTELFGFHIPERWCAAHYYQAMLNGEPHVPKVRFLTTLAGYLHWKLTGRKAAGLGEASGIFPVDPATKDYDENMLEQFRTLTGKDIRPLLPEALPAGTEGGRLSAEGARFLDPSGALKPGVPAAPCEGDAATGLVATNSVRAGTGNVSAGTSAFAMFVADHPLGVHPEVDMLLTPDGSPVAMVHAANCTNDLNAWVGLLSEFAELTGNPAGKGELFEKLFRKAMEAEPDAGGLLSYNCISGEHMLELPEGRPVFLRTAGGRLTLANFMRAHLMSALAVLKTGTDFLRETEQIRVDRIFAHGGFFKTPLVGQRLLASALQVPVSLLRTAGEGGPYGMALLADYMIRKEKGETLSDYLDNKVFRDAETVTVQPDPEDAAGFLSYMERYRKALPVERTAAEVL